MNSNLLFIASATALAAIAVLLLAPVLWRARGTSANERNGVNVAVLRDQWAELERDIASGTLSAADQEQAKQELQKRVLAEAGAESTTCTVDNGSKRTAVAFAVLLPLAAFAAYVALGNPAALSPPLEPVPQFTRSDVEAMVASLEEKLKQNPDDQKGWAMLARSLRVFGRHKDAAEAFARAGGVVESDPQLLTEYAETLALSRDGDLTGEPTKLLERALKLDPTHPFALALAGSAAFARADYAVATTYWQRLHAQLPPDSEMSKAIAEGLDKARRAQDEQSVAPRSKR